MATRPTALGLAVFVVISGVGACEPVPLPTSDSTAPSLTWNVFDKDANSGVDYPATSNVSIAVNKQLRVTLRAQDGEGVKSVDLGGGSSWTCRDGDIGQAKSALFSSQHQAFTPDANNKVLTLAPLIMELTTNLDCAGLSFAGGSISLSGKAENYFGGITMGKLTIDVPQ